MQMISEVMTRNVQAVSPRDSLRHAAQLMDDLNVGALPVCDGERLVGMVTDRDITVRATSAGIAPDDAVVDDVMSADVRWCFEDQPVEEVMQQMASSQIRRVPVVSHDEAHRLVGIVALGDIATAADAGQQQQVEQVLSQVSYPSEPDRSSSASQGTQSHAAAQPSAAGSETGTGAGLAGADVLDEVMSPKAESSSADDPSDVVEVSPNDLVNRNAPGSTSLSPDSLQARMQGAQEINGVAVRRTQGNPDSSSVAGAGASGGTDAAGVSGASGGTAGTSGSGGTGVGAKP